VSKVRVSAGISQFGVPNTPENRDAVAQVMAIFRKEKEDRLQAAVDKSYHTVDGESLPTADADDGDPSDPLVLEEFDSPEARQKRMDHTLALIAFRDSFGHLSRYETSLMNGLNRTVALLHVMQTSRSRPGDSEALLM
jgi:hypothetical protein